MEKFEFSEKKLSLTLSHNFNMLQTDHLTDHEHTMNTDFLIPVFNQCSYNTKEKKVSLEATFSKYPLRNSSRHSAFGRRLTSVFRPMRSSDTKAWSIVFN